MARSRRATGFISLDAGGLFQNSGEKWEVVGAIDNGPGAMDQSKHPIFAGEFRYTMDAKHRATLPASWRTRSDGEFFLIPSQESDHLLGYTSSEFEKVSQLVCANPSISPRDQRIFIRQFYSKAQLCTVDRQGRLLIPEGFRRVASLDRDLLFVGAFNRFEIWNPDRWTTSTANEQSIYAQVANAVGL